MLTKIILCWHLVGRSVQFMDLWIRIRTKMSRIHNAVFFTLKESSSEISIYNTA
jgi:hypothetical protein